MLLPLLTLIAGFAVLTWSADRFVFGASGTARALHVPTLIIGLTIVGIGTSAPEMLVSGIAAWQDNAGIAVGNAVGSNITNIALVLGVTALLYPLKVRSRIVRREIPLLLAIMALSLALLLDGAMTRTDGLLLLVGMAGLLGWMGLQGRGAATDGDSIGVDLQSEVVADAPLGRSLLWLVVGLALMLASSRALVWAAVDVARTLGISDQVIGLTIVALGTSLPELAASVASARKGEHDIAIGNVVGSNMFNLLGVLGIAGAVTPFAVERATLVRDYPTMAALTVLLLLLSRRLGGGGGRINRAEGALLVVCYLVYSIYLGVSQL